MHISYARTPLQRSIFLAGPTPRDANTESWRPQAIELLQAAGFDGIVYVPENSDGSASFTYDGQVEWELQALHASSVVLFWIPRSMTNMPALTTNIEYGHFISRRNVVVGIPDSAERIKYLLSLAKLYGHHVHNSLSSTCLAAIEKVNRPFATE